MKYILFFLCVLSANFIFSQRVTTPPTGLTDAISLQGVAISTNTPTSGSILNYNGVSWGPFSRITSATLDFQSTAANGFGDLTIPVVGALNGDVVSLGVPSTAATSGLFFVFVSATDVVTVRFHNAGGAGPVDPVSGTFKVSITK